MSIYVDVKISGTRGIMMHNGQLANPLNPWSVAIKELGGKGSRKTEAQIVELYRLEFMGGLVKGDDGGPVVTADMILSCIKEGAKARKMGKASLSSIDCMQADYPLIYDGPRDPNLLWEAKDSNGNRVYADIRNVKIQRATIQRCRPLFKKWSLKFDLEIDEQGSMKMNDVKTAIEQAGCTVGLGEYRPRYGRFNLDSFKVQK